jgi:hypothetical protein
MSLRLPLCCVYFALFAQLPWQVTRVGHEMQHPTTTQLRARIEASPILPFKGVLFSARIVEKSSGSEDQVWETGHPYWLPASPPGAIRSPRN